MIERTEELALAGLLPITIGGRTRDLRTLKIRESRAWKELVAGQIANLELPDADGDFARTLAGVASLATDRMLDLLIAYDTACGTRSGVLEPREQLEALADDRDVYEALKATVTATFPFVTGARSVVEAFGPQLRQLTGALTEYALRFLQQVSTTNGHSPSGSSTPTPLTPISATSSSSSSGPTASIARRERRQRR